MNNINIFTDGSSLIKQKNYESSSGVIIHTDKITYNLGAYHKGGTISYGEMFAIIIALKFVSKLFDISQCNINLYSDSEYCVNSLTKWVNNWQRYGRYNTWYKSTGEEVMYQDLIKYVYYNFLENRDNIHIYHMRGHINEKISMEKAYKKFINKYNVNMSINDFSYVVEQNHNVDKLADTIRCNKIQYYMHPNNNNGKYIIYNNNIFNPITQNDY